MAAASFGQQTYGALGGVFGTSRTSFSLCWGGCRPHHRPSRYRERRRAWWMVGAGGGEVALRITGGQKSKKEKVKILPVDRADSGGEDSTKSGIRQKKKPCLWTRPVWTDIDHSVLRMVLPLAPSQLADLRFFFRKKRDSFFRRSTTPLVLSAAAGRIKGSCWHPRTAHHLALRWLPYFRR